MAGLLKGILAFFLSLSVWNVPVQAYPHRSVLLDCGRKYYTIGWIQSLIDHMAENHANELILHFSDDMALRIESLQYPWLAGSDNAFSLDPDVPDPDPDKIYSQEDIKKLAAYAKERGIELIPGFDSPGHLHYVLDQYEKHYGRSIALESVPSCLDLDNEEGVAFIRSLQTEYANLFAEGGSEQFDIGGDEAVPDWNAPGVFSYDTFLNYMNETNRLIKSLGYRQCRMYSDQIFEDGLDADIAIAVWELGPHTPAWYGQKHEVLNYLNFYLYFVLDPDLVFVGADPQAIEREFSPTWFCGWPVHPESITGSCLCIWSDIPGSMSEQQVMEGILPLLEAWSHKNSLACSQGSPTACHCFSVASASIPEKASFLTLFFNFNFGYVKIDL